MKNLGSAKYFFTLTILLFCSSAIYSLSLYDNNLSNVVNLNPKNFGDQIIQNRSKNIVSIVHFYKLDDGKSRGMKLTYEKFAEENDGLFKVTAMNCKEFQDICEKQEVREYPTFKIYPPLPAPIFVYEGKIESQPLTSALGRYIGSKLYEVNNNNIDNFLNERINLPKCFLFTEKKGNPLIIKALSVAFDKKIDIGIVRSSESAIVTKYRIKKFPTVLVLTVGERKQKLYEGNIRYKELFDWMNIFSETFFRVGEDKARSTDRLKAEKPWAQEKLPEFTKDSANEICFKVEGTICVLLINKEKPSEDLIALFNNLQNHLSPKIDRGIKYRFGWINSSTQNKYIESVGLSNGDGPKLMIVNPGSRKRYHTMETELNEMNMKNTFDKLAGGEIRFKNFPRNTIPELD